MINVCESAGSGVPDIYAVWESEGWKEPIVEEKYNPDSKQGKTKYFYNLRREMEVLQ